MTTRAGEWAQQTWRTNRAKHPCNLVKVIREDGAVTCFTDLDRQIDFEGDTYRPIALAGMSADRREAALKSGNQELYGIIDGNSVLLPDMLGDRYRGAEVRRVITDWALPLLVIDRHRKWIRSVTFTGSSFTATLEGITQRLQRPAGGRFGGTFTTTCPYKLGGQFCRKNVNTSPFRQAGIRVTSVVTSRMIVETASSTWEGSQDDDFYRDGDMAWRWSAPDHSGSGASVTGKTLLTDGSQSWDDDELVGMECRILQGSTSGYVIDYATITANTATTITVDKFANTHGGSQYYDVCGFAKNKGVVSPIVQYRDADRRLTFNFPTPFPIEVGDSGIVMAGCDGLKTTCIDKFDDLPNFGGDSEAPSAGKVLEPPTS